MRSMVESSKDLDFDELIQSYIDKNSRFIRREWLGLSVNQLLRESARDFVLITSPLRAHSSRYSHMGLL
jgi:hypothetical protein